MQCKQDNKTKYANVLPPHELNVYVYQRLCFVSRHLAHTLSLYQFVMVTGQALTLTCRRQPKRPFLIIDPVIFTIVSDGSDYVSRKEIALFKQLFVSQSVSQSIVEVYE